MDEQTLADVPLSPHWVTSDRGPAMNTLTGRTSPPWLTVSIGVTRTDRSATVINKRTSSTCCPIVLPQAQLLFFVTAVKQLLQSMRRFRPCFVYMSMLGWLTDFVGPSQLVHFFFKILWGGGAYVPMVYTKRQLCVIAGCWGIFYLIKECVKHVNELRIVS